MNQELIGKYVAGKLSQAEAEAFEEHCLSNPEFARQVEFEQRLKLGIRQVASGSTAEFVRAEEPGRWQIAMAASLVLAVALGWYAWRLLPVAHPKILAAVTTELERRGTSMRLALVRGAESVPTLQQGVVRVQIVGLFDPGFHYSIALDRIEKMRSANTLATLPDQHPTSPVTLEFMIDSDQLQPGAYSLRVRKESSDEDALDFGFAKF